MAPGCPRATGKRKAGSGTSCKFEGRVIVAQSVRLQLLPLFRACTVHGVLSNVVRSKDSLLIFRATPRTANATTNEEGGTREAWLLHDFNCCCCFVPVLYMDCFQALYEVKIAYGPLGRLHEQQTLQLTKKAALGRRGYSSLGGTFSSRCQMESTKHCAQVCPVITVSMRRARTMHKYKSFARSSYLHDALCTGGHSLSAVSIS